MIAGAVHRLGTLAVAWLVSQVSPAWTTRYLGVVLGPLLLLGAVGLARAGTLGLVALVIVLGIWAIPRTLRAREQVERRRPAQRRRARAPARATWWSRCSPSRGRCSPTTWRLGGAPKLTLRERDGRGRERPRDGLARRLRPAEGGHPAENLEPLLASVPAGGRVLIVHPVTLGQTTGTRPGPSSSGADRPSGARPWRPTSASSGWAAVPPVLPARHPHRSARSALREDRMSDERHEPTAPSSRDPELREKPTLILGGGPAGPHRRLPARQAGPARDRARGRGPGRRHRQDRGPRRLPLRPRRPPLLHEGARRSTTSGTRSCARSSSSARACRASTGTTKFLDYPLRGPDVIKKLGPVELTRALLSYLWAAGQAEGQGGHLRGVGLQPLRQAPLQPLLQVLHREGLGRPHVRDPRRVGRAADQGPVVLPRRQAAFFGNKGNKVTTLIAEFHYPRFGPGQMWEQMTNDIEQLGGQVLLEPPGHEARARRRPLRARHVPASRCEPSAVISSLPLRNTVGIAEPAPAARGDRRRRGPALPRLPHGRGRARRRGPLPGQLDLHPRARRGGRAHPELPLLEPVDGPGPDQGLRRPRVLLLRRATSCGRWTTTSSSSSACASSSSSASPAPTSSSSASSSASRRRTRCTTPTTPSASTTIRSWLDGLDNFIQVGRNGLHRYNNSDHSMLTAMRAVDNLVKGTDHDIWAVNAESAYHEEEQAGRAAALHRGARDGGDEGAAAPLGRRCAACSRLRPRARRRLPARVLERAARRGARQRGGRRRRDRSRGSRCWRRSRWSPATSRTRRCRSRPPRRVLHVGYLALLARAYQGGEVSVVYPVSRGTAPVLVLVVRRRRARRGRVGAGRPSA